MSQGWDSLQRVKAAPPPRVFLGPLMLTCCGPPTHPKKGLNLPSCTVLGASSKKAASQFLDTLCEDCATLLIKVEFHQTTEENSSRN